MIQALVVRSVSGRHIAKDVHLKVWSRGDGDETPTFSFAHHGLNEVNHQEEYTIRWFKETPELRDPAKLILRAYSMETDLNYGQRPEQLPRRSSTFGSIFRRPSDNANTSRPPSISMSTQSLYETKGIPPPPAVQRLGGIEIEFQSSSRKSLIN